MFVFSRASSSLFGKECSLCGDPFKSGEQHFKVEDTLWHVQCFRLVYFGAKLNLMQCLRCAQCFCLLEEEVYFNVEGRMYCQHDFEVNYAPLCHKCG